jgi:hypothetical protein
MGTRGTTGIIINNIPKLTFNNFDSYPSGLGNSVIEFIKFVNKEENGWEILKKNADKVVELDGNELDSSKEEDRIIIEKYKKYADLGVSNKRYEDLYCLFRKIQGIEWLYEIFKGELEHYVFNNNFIKDSLYCEYAYIINLDTMKLEFYDGFQKKPQKGNRFGEIAEKEYFPCRLVSVFNLNGISTKVIKKMEKICESNVDDPSVQKYFRKPKLDILNKKASL